MFSTRPGVTIDHRGTVWATADGLQTIPAGSMQWPEKMDAGRNAPRGQTQTARVSGVPAHESVSTRLQPVHQYEQYGTDPDLCDLEPF
jgi:hypothetical protein